MGSSCSSRGHASVSGQCANVASSHPRLHVRSDEACSRDETTSFSKEDKVTGESTLSVLYTDAAPSDGSGGVTSTTIVLRQMTKNKMRAKRQVQRVPPQQLPAVSPSSFKSVLHDVFVQDPPTRPAIDAQPVLVHLHLLGSSAPHHLAGPSGVSSPTTPLSPFDRRAREAAVERADAAVPVEIHSVATEDASEASGELSGNDVGHPVDDAFE
jgi:hypothetical protein